MATILPRPDSSIFLLCEDVRQELGNKLSFMGVFVNNDLVIPKGTPALLMPSLVFVLLAIGGNGTVTTQIFVFDPTGQMIFETPADKSTMETGKSHLMLTKMVGLTLKVGVYTVKFVFDSFSIERKFEVKEQ